MAQDKEHKRQEEIARKVLKAENDYSEFATGQDFWDRERDVRRKCIDLFGEYQYGPDLFEV